jgi:hypothetical protein
MITLMHYVLAAFAEQQNQSKTRHRTMPRHEKIDGFHTLHRIIRDGIDTLMVPTIGTNPSHPLGVVDRRTSKVCVVLSSPLSRSRMRCQIKVLKTTYDEYRTTTYDPAAKITLKNKLTTSEDEVSSWKKNIKISPMDYKLQGRSQLDSFQGTLHYHH